jgi:polar amino acid transport system substrate-binding protein
VKLLKVLCFLLLSCRLVPATATPGQTLRVAVGETKPPYVLAEEQRGIEVELLTAILKDAGYTAVLQYVPNRRARILLESGLIDAAISPQGEFLSEPYIAYQNMAFTLCRSSIELHRVTDLAGRRVAAFHNARLFLGPEFAQMAAGNPDYREPPQASINRLLYAGAVDIGVGDVNIVHSINGELGLGQAAAEALCAHPLFPPTLYRLAFRDRAVRDSFNAALKRALQRKLYESLAQRYRLPMEHGHPYFKPSPATRNRTSHVQENTGNTYGNPYK